MRGYGEKPPAGAGANSVSVRNTFRRQQGRSGPDGLDGSSDLKSKLTFKDVDYLILPVMNVQWRGVAIRHAVLKDRNTVFPVLLSNPDVHQCIEEPDPLVRHICLARIFRTRFVSPCRCRSGPAFAQAINISFLCAARKLFSL